MSAMTSQDAPIYRITRTVRQFLKLESTAGLLLLIATVAAMLVKNSSFGEAYTALLMLEGEVRIGTLAVEKPLFLWVNDGWMALFFFVVGLEIKHELTHGHLSDRSQVVLPLFGAIGGVAVPALIYVGLTAGDSEAVRGWAVPTATDIAFALGVLAAVGSRVPIALKIFLMTLAILDDLMAIVIIALFYTSGLSLTSLALSFLVIAVMAVLKYRNIGSNTPFLMLGMLLWVCVLKSGVHATLAGVITAFFISTTQRAGEHASPAKVLIDDLHPWIVFVILPTFAFINAGIDLEGIRFERLLEPVPLGIALGLFVGKPVGVLLGAGAAVGFGMARLPENIRWAHLVGVAFLCGVGFTMSLFIGGLAFAEGAAGYARIDRLGILVGSAASAVVGYLVLRAAVSRDRPPNAE